MHLYINDMFLLACSFVFKIVAILLFIYESFVKAPLLKMSSVSSVCLFCLFKLPRL